MNKNRLAKRLLEARKIIETKGSNYAYAEAFGYLETAVEAELLGGDQDEQKFTEVENGS